MTFQPQAVAPPIFRVKQTQSPFICQDTHYKFDSYAKNKAGHFVF